MKVKVLTYANDGNTVCNKYMELIPVNYHPEIFTTPLEEYGRTNLVFQFKDIYYCEGSYNQSQIESSSETVINHYNNYLANLHTHKWIKSIYIALFESLGMDTNQLNEVRAKQVQEREQKRANEIQQKAIAAKEQNDKRLAELATAKAKLIAGDEIPKDDFLELIKMYNIPVHIRTIGMLNGLNKADIGVNKAHIFGAKTKGMNLDKVFEAAKLLAAC